MSVLSPALLGAVALVLLASAVGHLRRPVALRSGLLVHGVLPAGLRRPVAVLLPVAEAGLAVLALLALGGAGDPVLLTRVAGAGAFLLCAGFTAYLLAVLRTHPETDIPCACGIGEAAVGPASVIRAAVLALFAGAAALTAGGWVLGARPLPEVLLAVAAAFTLAVTVALLPAARAVPDGLTLAHAPAEGAR